MKVNLKNGLIVGTMLFTAACSQGEKEAAGTFERTETYKRRQTEGLIRFANSNNL